MQRKFIQNLAFLVLLNLLIKPFWLLQIDRTVQNRVGPEEYGLYFALFNFSYLLQIILDLGISNYNNKNIAQNRHLLGKYLPNILIIKSFLALLYFALTLFIAYLWQYNMIEFKMLAVLAFNQILASAVLFFRSNLAGLHLFKLDALFSVLDRFLMILICSILLWGNITSTPFQIEWFIYAQTASLGIAAILSAWMVLYRAKKVVFQWNYKLLYVILRQSYPFAILGILMTVYTRIDGVMIERFSPVQPEREAGLYANAYRILDATNMVSYLFATLLLPIYSRMIKLNQSTVTVTRLSVKTLLIPAIIFCITACFFRESIMYGLYKYTITYSTIIFGMLIFTFIPMSSGYIFGTLLTANGSLKILNISAAIGVGLNIILNYFLIIHYQALGATVATVATQYLVAVIQLYYAVKIFRYRISMSVIAKVAGLILGVIIINYGMQLTGLQWVINFFLTLGVGALLGIILNLIDVKALYKLLMASSEGKY